DDPSITDRGIIISRSPILGARFSAPVHMIGLERFDCEGRVAKIFKSQLVEIALADIHGDVTFVARVADPFPPKLRHDVDLTDNLWQLAVAGLIEIEGDFVFVALRQL